MPDSSTPTSRISVIILNWNGWEDTLACLESVRHSDYPDYRIILVDNGSTNDSVERISAWCANNKIPVISIGAIEVPGEAENRDNLPPIARPLVIIETGKNLGFSEGNNVAIRHALAGSRPADVVFLLNNDTKIEPGAISRAVKVLRERQAGIVGCHIKDAAGTMTLFGGDLRPSKFFYAPYRFFLRRHKPGDEAVSVIWGTAMLIRRDVLLAHEARFGHFLDPSYFLYMEDYDFCFRTQKMGYSIFVAKDAVVYHGHTANYAQTNFRNAITLYYSTRNAIHIAAIFLPLGWRLIFHLYFPLVRGKDIFSLLLHRKTVGARALLAGLRDGYLGVRGEWRKHPTKSRTS